MNINYKVLPTFKRIHADNNPYLCVMGPVGSGKSSGCIFHILMNAMKQVPDENGIRRSRYMIIRKTYPALKSTVIKTWIDWFKDKLTIVYSTPITGRLRYPLADGTSIDMELMFIAVDDAASAEKLRSLEVTGVHINEASEIDKGVFQICTSRFGRFPAQKDGGCVDKFILMDYNAVAIDHWLYNLAEEIKPEGFSFYKQPPALIKFVEGEEENIRYEVNPNADNIENLNSTYYMDMVAANTDDFIEVNLLNNYGEVRTGRPVYKYYQDTKHVPDREMLPVAGVHVIIGMDGGLQPAAAFTQQLYDGSVIVFDEIVTDDCSMQEFIEEYLLPTIRQKYPDILKNYTIVVDPAAMQRAQTDKKSIYHMLKGAGLNVKLANTNNTIDRLEAVIRFLRRDGSFKLSPTCRNLRKGFISEYKYKEKTKGSGLYQDKPEKNEYSHIHDALQYAMLEYVQKPKKKFFTTSRRYTAASSIGGY